MKKLGSKIESERDADDFGVTFGRDFLGGLKPLRNTAKIRGKN